MTEEDDLLACLLDVAEAELNSLNGNKILVPETNINSSAIKIGTSFSSDSTQRKSLHDVDIFAGLSDEKELTPRRKKKIKEVEKGLSEIHKGDTDSSDEEGNRNYENQKYSQCGKDVKDLLHHSVLFSDRTSDPGPSRSLFPQSSLSSKSWKSNYVKEKGSASVLSTPKSSHIEKVPTNVYTDPIFGISIINPVISSKVFEERMAGRRAIPICQISRHLKTLKKDEDWVIAGVLCNKGVTKTSAKGNQFMIWTMSDLLGDIKTIAMFLFGSAYKQFWKIQPGSVVGVLNPSILDKKEGSRDEATLSVDNAQKIMVLGQSRDLSTCKSTKKSGEKCTSIVNKSKCEVCIYHMRQEYQKCSQRSDLQANFSGKGLVALRNKVLGKNEVFYAGKSYMAIPAKQSRKLIKKDQNRLNSLNGTTNAKPTIQSKKKPVTHKAASSFDVVPGQRMKDMETLRKLGVNTEKYGRLGGASHPANHSSQITLDESKANALKVLSKLNGKSKETSPNSDKISSITQDNNKNMSELENSQLQKSLDEIVKNDFVNLDIDYKNSKNNISDNNTNTKNSLVTSNNREITNLKSPITTLENQKKKESEKSKEIQFIANSVSDKTENISELLTTEKLGAQNLNMKKKVNLVFGNSLLMSTIPSLSTNEKTIDLNRPIIPRQAKKAKLDALKFIQKHGPIKKVDPNNTRGTGLKRNLDDADLLINSENAKKLKKIQENEFLSDRFKKMMELQSKHMDLVEVRDNEEKEKYFKKLEVKEQMEEKMSNTYKLACKAVRCLNCKYTSFSAADKCKAEKHRLKVYDATKRFFKCGHCGNRVAILDVVPLHPCKNCGNGKWERTTMMKEKNVTNTVSLSIRGGEQKFANSVVTDANINLLVPDED